MTLNLVNQVGESNPQLFRELKGRVIPRNILIAVATSLLGQLLLLISFGSKLPVADGTNPIYNRYCTGASKEYSLPTCVTDGLGSFIINWQLWWQDVFVWLSLIGIFALLVVGTYMLIGDLSKEESNGTLNFLRLSPGSSFSILGGKLLGVPILLYSVAALALPLHLVSGLSGHIPLSEILGFYVVIGSSCLFFYSTALLFGLVGNWLGGFQAWLGSGIVLIFLLTATQFLHYNSTTNHPSDWLMLFNPAILLPYLIDSFSLSPNSPFSDSHSVKLLWFYVPIGAKIWSFAGFIVLNFGLWSYWIWQGLNRCFHNPKATLLNKGQSYRLTACFEVVLLGFALNPNLPDWKNHSQALFENFQMLLVFNLLLFLGLIVALSPHRQTLQDWARYRHQHKSIRKGGILSDLIWGKNSPGVVAVGMNLAIASTILSPWILLWPTSEYKTPALLALLLNATMIIFYASVVQLMLLMKTPKRAIWAAGTVTGFITLPPMVLSFLSMLPSVHSHVWLFSAFSWASVEYAAGTSVAIALVTQSLALVLLNLQLTRQLRKVGESATKTLLSPRPLAVIE